MFKIWPGTKQFIGMIMFMMYLAPVYAKSNEQEVNIMPLGQDPVVFRDMPFYDSFRNIADEQLQELMRKMFSHNHDLKQMLATVKRLRAEYAITRLALYPKAELATSTGISGRGVSDSRYSGDYQLSLPVSYEMDVWKRLRAQSEAALLKSEATVYDRQALSITLAAELMERYYTGLYLREQLSLLNNVINLATQINQLLRYKYDAGMVGKNEVYAGEQRIKQLSVEQILVSAELSHIEHALKVIIGEYPVGGWLKGSFIIPGWLEYVPAGLPSNLAEQRPDLRAIQLRLNSAAYRVYAAERASFPSFRLTSSANTASDELKKLVDGNSISWGAFVRMSFPVFDGHRNKAAYETELFVQQESAEEYKQVLLNAFNEVETALSNGKQQAGVVAALQERNALMGKKLTIVKAQYDFGLKDLLKVTSEKQEMIFAKIELCRAQLQLVSYRIQLFRSLGDGWWAGLLAKDIDQGDFSPHPLVNARSAAMFQALDE